MKSLDAKVDKLASKIQEALRWHTCHAPHLSNYCKPHVLICTVLFRHLVVCVAI